MCGINGILGFHEEKIDEESIEVMNNAIFHRGPDEGGIFTSTSIGLGHRRLSIIDLETGTQPITNENNSLFIVFNGEIYNFKRLRGRLIKKGHRFKTHTDTEVIVHLYEEYGLDFLSKLNGMFAFALWDQKKKRLIVARDPVGIKPLIYFIDKNRFIFSSELSGILSNPDVIKKLNYKALSFYFDFGFIPAPYTVYEDIRKLEPGHFIIANKNGVEIKKYWCLQENIVEDSTNIQQSSRNLRLLLKKSIEDQIISDVPLGAFLSGGLDSSAVVGLMSELGTEDINTFSIGFQGLEVFDETKYARIIADRFDTKHHEFIIDSSNVISEIPIVLNSLDEPFADQSILPTYMISEYTREKVKVALSGDGGDELFAGYDKYLGEYYFKMFKRIPKPFVQHFIDPIISSLPSSRENRILEFFRKAKKFYGGTEEEQSLRHYKWMQIVQNNNIFRYKDASTRLSIDSLYNKGCNFDRINKMLYVDFKCSLPNDMLFKVDQASMMNSLEVRVPLLDLRVLNYSFSLPGIYKMQGRNRKMIFKRALRDILPREILNRSKKGFDMPIGEWIRDDIRNDFEEVVNIKKIKEQRFLDDNKVKKMIEKHMAKKEDYSKPLWAIFVFQWWFSKYDQT